MKIGVCIIVLATAFAGLRIEANATTWAPKKVVCTLCKTENTFMEIASYGTYIYNWPEKFQYIFWPLTDANVLYSCKKCRLTAFMWDFEQLPVDKLPEIKRQLDSVGAKPFEEPYWKEPMSARLEIAAKVYSVLSKGDSFWCQFYRVQGYHFEAEKRESDAASARRKALEMDQKQLSAAENAGVRKELLLISGAMRYFLKDDPAALKDLREAAGLTYRNPKLESEQATNVDRYLSALLKEYIARIEAGVKPSNR